MSPYMHALYFSAVVLSIGCPLESPRSLKNFWCQGPSLKVCDLIYLWWRFVNLSLRFKTSQSDADAQTLRISDLAKIIDFVDDSLNTHRLSYLWNLRSCWESELSSWKSKGFAVKTEINGFKSLNDIVQKSQALEWRRVRLAAYPTLKFW